MSSDQVIGMIAMRNWLLSTVHPVNVLSIVAVAGMAIGAGVGNVRTYLERVLIHVSLMRMMHVTIVKEVHVIIMLDGGVAAVAAMLMGMVLVNYVGSCHDRVPFR